MDYVEATYLVETPLSIDEAVSVLAGEQSSGTFVEVPGETAALRARHGAQVGSITELESVSSPSLPGSLPSRDRAQPAKYRRARVVIRIPAINIGDSLPNLVTAVAGNLFELRELSGIRLEDVQVPHSFAKSCPRPAFGIEGTRKLTGVWGRPIIGTIIKPSVGLTPQATGMLVGELVRAGVDFIKDDELIADPPYSRLADRAASVMAQIRELRPEVMYAFNITGDADELLIRHDTVVENGGTCVMVSVNSVGMAGVIRLRRNAAVPIHAHRNGWGMLTRAPMLGMSFIAYQKIWRLAGVDQIHINGIRNKFWESDESVIRSGLACLDPEPGGTAVMPVISSGQWAGQAEDTFRHLRTQDLMYLAGGGILGHPSGAAAGVASIRQAWEAAVEGQSINEAARTHPELAEAFKKFCTR